MPEPSWIPEAEGGDTLEDNWLFRLRRERFRSRATGKVHDYYVVHLADAVNVVAITTDRRLVLVRQFRAGSGRDSLETPGGLLNAGEDPLAAGARELLEETGYAGSAPRWLGTVWTNPSLLSSRTTTILIEDARPVAPTAFDDHEELTLDLIPEAGISAMIEDGRLDHALVVQGLLAWMAWRDGRLRFDARPRGADGL
ncbi:MAG TPA: NUDIX hydrolase [Isosphaeraceae bacterium]|jgi:8-oxo-dGTP pyrophosphatase MutT (NUDIX family)